ncbi:toprim domain-containing protein [Helicobacter pylori]
MYQKTSSIAEKSSMGRLIANALSNDYNVLLGYFQLKNGDIVTFASGHLLALKEPQDYDPTLSKWDFEKLPLMFYDVAFKSVPNNSQQLSVIQKLLSQPFDKIYHCGDSDQEGQIIIYLFSLSISIKSLTSKSLCSYPKTYP